MRIPHTQLSSTSLRAVVEEFVTRDGTDHSSVERRIEANKKQNPSLTPRSPYDNNFADVRGQEMAKHAITIAAAGSNGIANLTSMPESAQTRVSIHLP